MKPVNILIAVMLAPIALIIIIIILVYLYAWGPIFFLRLTPYEIEQRRIAFPQWINNDEICYLELVLHRDKTVFEQGKFILFIKKPIMDVYIYREKANHPEARKLVKHFARVNMQPNQSLEGSLDINLGFRVYDNGKKIFLYYNYYGGVPSDYRYVTMDTNGRSVRERIPKIIPLDVSQDGGKIYGVLRETNEDKFENDIMEYDMKDNKLKKIIKIAEDKFKQSMKGDIKDLKLISKDKLMFSYRGNYTKLKSGDYTYLIDILTGNIEFVNDFSLSDYSNTPYYPYLDGYTFEPYHGYVLSKDGKYLIAGNSGIYTRKADSWIKIEEFYKEYPAISPRGEKVSFVEILVKKGELKNVWLSGRRIIIMNFKDLLDDKRSGPIR